MPVSQSHTSQLSAGVLNWSIIQKWKRRVWLLFMPFLVGIVSFLGWGVTEGTSEGWTWMNIWYNLYASQQNFCTAYTVYTKNLIRLATVLKC